MTSPRGLPGAIARAPGKLVLSGAYAVLEGAPAVVAAVDRYVIADARRAAVRVTAEVRKALDGRGGAEAPWFDAGALRDEARGQKLGLGSSAAILVASLAALELSNEPGASDTDLARRVMPEALRAHRAAQGGGSGADVAASALGGILRFQRKAPDGPPRIDPMKLPEPLFFGVWSSPSSACTSDMLACVAALRRSRPADHRGVMDQLCRAALAAADAPNGARFVQACREQVEFLSRLGDLAGVPIVTSETRAFGRAAGDRGVILPSGAGGGDVVLYVGTEPPYEAIESEGRKLGFVPLPVSIGARGVHGAPRPWQDAERNEAST
jgi:phosphomevalonate kinase